jgi:hypothetical protein
MIKPAPSNQPSHPPVLNEDWLALAIGLGLFLVSLIGVTGHEPFGWAIKTNIWLAPWKIMTPASASFAKVPGPASLVLTFLVMALVLGTGARLLGARIGRFLAGFTVLFFLSYGCYALDHFAYIAATPDQLPKLGITWSLT